MLFFFVLQRGNGCLGGGYLFVGSSEGFRCRFDIFLRRADLAVAFVELLLRGFLCRLGEGYFSAGFFDFHLPCGDRAWRDFVCARALSCCALAASSAAFIALVAAVAFSAAVFNVAAAPSCLAFLSVCF